MNKRKLILRLVVSPFVLGILIVTYAYNCGLHFIKFLRYGGEWATYMDFDRATMDNIYKELKAQRNIKNRNN